MRKLWRQSKQDKSELKYLFVSLFFSFFLFAYFLCVKIFFAVRVVFFFVPKSDSIVGRFFQYVHTIEVIKIAAMYLISDLPLTGSEEEAAMAYDIETIKKKGWNAQTNFSLALYDVAGIRAGTANPPITEEAAKYLQQATMWSSSGEAQGHSSSGYHSILHQAQISFVRYSQTLMHILSAHSNFQTHNVAGSSAQHMFSHSSSSPFKPYVKN